MHPSFGEANKPNFALGPRSWKRYGFDFKEIQGSADISINWKAMEIIEVVIQEKANYKM
jgi:hypothetical protein